MESQRFTLEDGTDVCVIPTETIIIRQKSDVVMLTGDQLAEIFIKARAKMIDEWDAGNAEANG